MSKKYAFRITEDVLDLIEKLNGGMRPQVEEEKSFFLYTADETTPSEIVTEDSLYNKEGYLEDQNIQFVYG